MRSQDFLFAIVLADDIEHVSETILIVTAYIWTKERLRYRPRRIFGMKRLDQRAKDALRKVGSLSVVDFIPSAVNDYTRMIAIAANCFARVGRRPLIEVQ